MTEVLVKLVCFLKIMMKQQFLVLQVVLLKLQQQLLRVHLLQLLLKKPQHLNQAVTLLR